MCICIYTQCTVCYMYILYMHNIYIYKYFTSTEWCVVEAGECGEGLGVGGGGLRRPKSNGANQALYYRYEVLYRYEGDICRATVSARSKPPQLRDESRNIMYIFFYSMRAYAQRLALSASHASLRLVLLFSHSFKISQRRDNGI